MLIELLFGRWALFTTCYRVCVFEVVPSSFEQGVERGHQHLGLGFRV